LIIAPSQSAKAAKELLPMSISAITTSAPVTMSTPATASDTPAAKTPETPNGSDAGDATEAQPPVVAALPPGQGTRIDQIV
jgi:hypothetical protein